MNSQKNKIKEKPTSLDARRPFNTELNTSHKAIIFDASTLISFSMNGLLQTLKDLKQIFKGRFIITNDVKKEVIDKPMTIKRFELEALRLKQLFDDRILETPGDLGINESELSKKTNEILDMANQTFFSSGKDIKLIDSGEASCLALSKLLSDKGIQNVIAVDERTTRMLGEKPENLKKLFEKKLHAKINSKKENYKFFKGFQFIRSAELIYVAYRKKIIKVGNGKLLDALLYSMKFKGCAISGTEIEEMKKLP